MTEIFNNGFGEIHVIDNGFLIADGYEVMPDGRKIPYAFIGDRKVPFSFSSEKYCIHVTMRDE